MKPRKPIRRVSKKRAKQNSEYSKRRKAFLEAHPYCQLFLLETFVNIPTNGVGLTLKDAEILSGGFGAIPPSVEIHHKRGRFGSRLNDETYWLAVSEEGHRWLHNNPKEAYAKGYMLPR